jgi:predicted amidohydrolase YtcJ
MTYADTLIFNASIITLDAEQDHAQSVALKDGKILAVGTDDALSAMRGPSTKLIDAKGNTVLPGFSENHMHIFTGAAELDHLQLGGVHGLEALSEAIRAYAAARPHQSVLFTQGADYAILGSDESLDRHRLDTIISDQAILISAPDHHTSWANTKALEMAGILHGRELNVGNEIVMGEDGLATGVLLEMEAFGPVQAAGGFDRYRLGLSTGGEPEPFPDDATFKIDMDVMRIGLNYCAAHGITSVHNMDGNLYQLQLLEAIEKADGFLSCRVKIPFHYKKYMPLGALDKAVEMTARYNSDFISCGMVKVFYDGVLDSYTAVMIEPYANKLDTVGTGLFEPEEFEKVAVAADARGLQIAVHAIGDGAVRAVLDGYEAAQKTNGARDSRHRIEHIEVIHPDDISRFATLGVVASMQPPHPPGAMDFPLEPTISNIGAARWRYSYAWRTLKDAGTHIAFASDWPVSDISIIRGIQAAVTRKKWAETDPDQSFSLHEALAAYCVEGAYTEFQEHQKGQIKPGFVADIVILDGNIEATAPEQFHDLRTATTICGGRITFSM